MYRSAKNMLAIVLQGMDTSTVIIGLEIPPLYLIN
jgi:hypothetical protein